MFIPSLLDDYSARVRVESRSGDKPLRRPYYEIDSVEWGHYSQPHKKSGRPNNKNQEEDQHHYHFIPEPQHKPVPIYIEHIHCSKWNVKRENFDSLFASTTSNLVDAMVKIIKDAM